MAGFRFRLQKLLDLRERAEDARRRDLAASQESHLVAQEHLAAAHAARERAAAQVAGQMAATRAAGELLGQAHHLARLQDQSRQQAQRVRRLADEEARCREAALEAARQRQVLERFREGLEREYHDRLDRAEQRLLDEVGTATYVSHLAGR